ncbi:MAG: SRPBCC domain-containing protein [Taibaiella sp.]|nr:SRPBCC domain-containing protein [Taibaiella sp.]
MQQQSKSKFSGQKIKKGKQLYTSIVINATPARVWSVLMDFGKYPEWNPFIKSISGNVMPGEQITVMICPPGQKGMQLKPLILQNEAEKEFRWIGSLMIPYLFDGEHTFLLDDNGNGTTTFHHFEHFRGILVPLLKKMLDVNTKQGFEQMNAALKKQAEQG